MFAAAAAFAGTLALGAPAQAATNFDFWYAAGQRAVEAQCNDFNASQSQYHVNCVYQDSYESLFQKAIAAYRANRQPALVQFFDGGTLDLLLSNAVIPVTKIAADAGQKVDWNDYISGAKSYYATRSGELYGQPYNSSTLVFYTNDDMLKKAGITKAPETWEEVGEAAKKLKASGVACALTSDLHPWRVMEEFSAAEGIPIASEHNGYDGLDAKYVFNKGLEVQLITDLADWHKQGMFTLSRETKAGDYRNAFNSQECAMILNSTGGYTDTALALKGKAAFSVHLLPIFAGTKRYNTFVGGAALYAMKGFDAKTYKAVAAFLAFLRSPEQQMQMVINTGYLPVTKSGVKLMENGGLANYPERKKAAELGVESLNFPGNADTRGIRLGFFVQFREVFRAEITKVFSGESTPQQALDAAAARGDEMLKRFAATYAGAKMP
ncbi:extracellular solute-binding protein [Jiella sp. CQZ9-1]|uniref:sn-glycerol-3-phosphate-binding periplasmic protein UgpB n=2 Tax=Jiella flava TaxID=2816857 RepID=A0A939JWM5_9HYPH|nr:extracellular solute-binding protein [Jiella flava]